MKLPFGKTLSALCLTIAGVVGISNPSQATIITDIIMMVDESGSMGSVQTNLRNNIGTFASILSAGGIDARYGLVGYGSSGVVPRMLTDLTDATSFATAAQNLLINGGTEPGYAATAFGLNALDGQTDLFSFRTGALKNLIIFTDEPSNGDTFGGMTLGGGTITLASIDTLLGSYNALFNAVLSGSGTINSYQSLATNHSGNVYNLSGLNTTDQTVVSQFVADFADSKLKEIIDFCTLHPTDPACVSSVPEPGSMILFSLGLLGLGARRFKFSA